MDPLSGNGLNEAETSGSAIVPSFSITLVDVNEKSGSKFVEIEDSDEFLFPNVNSRTNLIEMGGRDTPAPDPNLLQSTAMSGEIMSNNSSQSSLDTGLMSRFGDEVDMIPLMPVRGKDAHGANGKLFSNGKGDGRNLIDNDGGGGTGGVGGHKEVLELENSSELTTANKIPHLPERWYTILVQVIVPFVIAGMGMVAAGVVLDIVQHWELYTEIKAIFTLIPALLGLKGNLEMTLAARFSTQVNVGKIHNRSTILSAVLGNFALTQAQAIVVGFLASSGALVLNAFTKQSTEPLRLDNSLVLLAGSVSTASFASLVLAGIMMFIIITSKQFNINPDNIATPIAASLGDLVTLSILSGLCTLLYHLRMFIWIHLIIIVSFLILVPIFMYYSYKNDFVRDALFNGWTPIIMAMIISSTGGFIMGFAVSRYDDIAVFQPVVNGVGGNLVAIFASRLSTSLHRTCEMGVRAPWAPSRWFNYPVETFFAQKNPESHTAIILAFMSLPGHLLFYFTITRIKTWQADHVNPATLTPAFISFYISVSVLQVILLLLICYWLVHLAWRLNKDPDNICIPYLTAIGDLLGTAFLAICFHVLYLSGETRLRTG